MDAKRLNAMQAREFAKFKQEIKRQNLRLIPSIYACFAKAMYDKGFDADFIAEVICYTQELWEESNERHDQMIEWCAETTGIELRGTEWIG